MFIDYQNCYKGARGCFFNSGDPSHVDGQIFPRLLGLKLKNDAAEYDVAVLMSNDTDLIPALEAVAEMKGTQAIEVATWVPPDARHATPLNVPDHGHLVHRLTAKDYGHVHDPTDYTQRRRRR